MLPKVVTVCTLYACIFIYNNVVINSALGPLQCEAASDYYVRPVSDTSCPGEPCLTWTEYVSHTDQYFHSNVTFWFISGTHHMNMPLKASNMSNVALIGFPNKPEVVGNISCKCVSTPCGCAGFMFSNSTNITIKMLSLSIQLHNKNSMYRLIETGGLSFFNISSLHITNCSASVTAVYNNTFQFIPCVMFISSSINVELTYIQASSTNGKGIYFVNTKQSSITNFIGYSRKIGIFLLQSFSISVRHSLIKGGIGIHMKYTMNITVSNMTISSSHSITLYLEQVINATICNVSICSLGMYVKESKHIIIVDFTVYSHSHDYGMFLLRSSAMTITRARITGYVGIRIENTTNCNIMNTAVMPARDRKHAIQLYHAINITISNTNITSPHCSGIYTTEASSTSLPLISSVHSNETVLHCYCWNMGINVIDGDRILINNSKVQYFTYTGIYVSNTVSLNILNSVIQNTTNGSIMKIEGSTNVFLHNLTARKWYSAIRVYRCQNITLSFIQITGYGSYERWHIYFTSSINIMLQNCHFTNFNSPWPATDVIRQPAVMEMNNNSGVTFHNSSFEGNSISYLKVVNTHFTVIGTLTFANNRAYRGAALVFIEKSFLTICEESTLVFKNNNATTTGGAIYVLSANYYVPTRDGLQSRSPCFLKVEDKSNTAGLIFKDNTAGQGGDVLYGGSLGEACTSNRSNAKYRCNSCLQVFHNISKISPKTLSSITSDPSRVCFCINNHPDCFVLFHSNFSLYSGQRITISAVVVGHDFGTVAGSVYYAHFLPDKEKDSSVTLGQDEESKGVKQLSCNNLTYTILSHSQSIKKVVLILTAVNKQGLQLILPERMDNAKKKFNKYEKGSPFPQELLDFPIYINITILLCPPVFSSTQQNPHCDCNEQLQQLPGISCDIQAQTISRTGQVWVGSVTDMNNTVTHVITSSQCPLQYCKREDVHVSLSQPDSQCRYNRSGILCGGCQPGLSLALGSSQCLECSNTYLVLLIPFALAGIVLVFFIKFLDLTISQGFINGFIFYANVIKANEHLLVPNGPINPLTLFISWLNLDLGIETCFFGGLHSFTKTLLQLVFPLYIWFTVWIIIMFSRYSRKIAKVFGRNSVPALATLFLLSYAKLIQLIVTALSYTFVEFPHGKKKAVWSEDGKLTTWKTLTCYCSYLL